MVYACLVIGFSLMSVSAILAYVDECSIDEDTMICLGLAAVETPVALGPFLLTFGYLFLLYERGSMAKRYGKSKFVLKPELHPKVNGARLIQSSPARQHLTLQPTSQEKIQNDQMMG